MGRLDRIRPYLEKLLSEGFGIPDLEPDIDGDYPFRYRSAGYYVRLINERSPTVQVFSVVVRDVKRSSKLLQAINDINAQIAFARVYLIDQQIFVATELVAETIDAEELGNACNIVGRIADTIGSDLQSQFGGSILFEQTEDDAAELPDTKTPATRAGYL